MKKASALTASAMVTMLALTGCADGGASQSARTESSVVPTITPLPLPSDESGVTPSETPLGTPTAKPAPISLGVRAANVKGVAAKIVTLNGRSAYRFEADSNKPSKVTCMGDCLVTWPPGLSDGSKVRLSAGIDPRLVSTVKRSDGLLQVTLGGWPLYLFEDDKTPADVKGEGLGGNWSAIKVDGKPVIKK